MAKTTPPDKKQIGLTAVGAVALDELMASGLFAAEADAYKLGIAYALAAGARPEDAPEGGYQTKYNAAGGLDVYGEIRDLITLLSPEHASRPYATAERLAEIGITTLARRLAANVPLADILAEAGGVTDHV